MDSALCEVPPAELERKIRQLLDDKKSWIAKVNHSDLEAIGVRVETFWDMDEECDIITTSIVFADKKGVELCAERDPPPEEASLGLETCSRGLENILEVLLKQGLSSNTCEYYTEERSRCSVVPALILASGFTRLEAKPSFIDVLLENGTEPWKTVSDGKAFAVGRAFSAIARLFIEAEDCEVAAIMSVFLKQDPNVLSHPILNGTNFPFYCVESLCFELSKEKM
jgi:hypothetical protein